MNEDMKRNPAIFCEAKNGTEPSLPEEIKKEYKIIFPNVYQNAQGMQQLASAKRTITQNTFYRLPFGHTVEAEVFGGTVKYNGEMAPYISSYPFRSLEEVLHLSKADFTKGRIYEVLLACKQLKEKEVPVLLEISGPFTILNGLLPSGVLLRAIRKEPDLFRNAWGKLSEFLLQYLEEIIKCHVDVVSYADSLAGADILGPKRAAQFAEMLVYPFLKQAEAQVQKKALILLCPKISYSLVETGKAVFLENKFEEPISYGAACLKSVGNITFAGEMCSKKEGVLLKNGILKEVKIL